MDLLLFLLLLLLLLIKCSFFPIEKSGATQLFLATMIEMGMTAIRSRDVKRTNPSDTTSKSFPSFGVKAVASFHVAETQELDRRVFHSRGALALKIMSTDELPQHYIVGTY